MFKMHCLLVLSAVLAGSVSAWGDVVLENARARLVIGDDAVAKSLTVKANGEEMLDNRERLPLFSATQDRPFNNEVKLTFPNCETVFKANRVRRAGEFLYVGFELVSYEAKIRVTEADGYFLFELVDFELGERGSNGLVMTYPPVSRLRLVNLPLKSRANFGQWLNVAWDEKAAAAVVAAEPYCWTTGEMRGGARLLAAEARSDLEMRGTKAALVVSETDGFLDAMDAFERDLGLPRGVASRRSDVINRSIYWTTWISPKNVDEHIAQAKAGGFRLMLIYYSAVCRGAQGDPGYGGIGDYEPKEDYANGIDSLKEMLAKIKAAGITPGLHVLQTFIGFKTHYVTPVADPRLNLKCHFTLAKTLADGDTDLYVQENPFNAPTNTRSRVLKFAGELISYEGFTTERPYRFTGIRRGHLETRLAPHPRGEIGGVLDVCEYGARSCYIDQDTDLQDEIAEKIARIYDAGFEFMYCDGSEGVSAPQGIHVANAQYRVWRKLAKKPLFMEGAAKTHFGWHHQSGANAFDVFPPELFKEMIVRWPLYEAPIMRQDFSRLNFGWWGVYLPGEKLRLRAEFKVRDITTVGVQPDMWEFGTSRAAAWDCPVTIQVVPEKLKKHPRMDDLLAVMRRWEDVRAKKWLTPAQKEALKSPTQEHHLYVNARGEYELHEIEMLPAPVQAKNARGFLFEREGRRMIACWHTCGEGTLSLTLDRAESVTLGGVRYFETGLSRDKARAAWAAARLAD